MTERGNCKFFSPNYFNPTKCQNCFKQKDQHTAQEAPITKPALARKASSMGRNVPPARTVLKESILWKGIPKKDGDTPKTWEKHWFTLLPNGELQQYAITDGQINKDKIECTVMLQDFIRMLDGKNEINEELCFGAKTLRTTTYFKTKTKVDYENWWKEFSSFVAAPIKRTTSTASALRSSYSASGHNSNYSKPVRVSKQHSMPSPSLISKMSTRSSRSSSISSIQSEPDHPQMETLRNQVSKLEEENSKLSKAEDQRRKLELEVNYWKEYVTKSQSSKRSGASVEHTSEISDARSKLLQLQDELNETQKKMKTNTSKLLMQNKDLADKKEKLHEANSIIAVHKAKIEHLTKEMKQKDQEKGLIIPAAPNELFYDGKKAFTEKTHELHSPRPTSGADGLSSSAQHLEDKFLVLKDRLKKIEKELFLKSKELEKANESRSKVAKYTRSLLQELETRLGDNQSKLLETEEKLKNANTELSMERERRMKLEEGPRRRMSSVASPPRPTSIGAPPIGFDPQAPPPDLTEHDADTKYADYYRSRFKEAEAALLEKDIKLHNAEEKIKEIQQAMKSNSDSYKVINDLQSKLSDATHKLSDRQLKIHELTREIDRLKGFEKTYTKKSKRCDTLEDIVKELEQKNAEQKKNLHQVKQELEIIKIREVVLHEQLQTFVEECETSEEDDEEGEFDEGHKLGKSIDLKQKIECMIELEALSKKLTIDNENLNGRNAELEARLRNINIQSFKTMEANKSVNVEEKPYTNEEKERYEQQVKELKQQLADGDDKYCKEVTMSKNKYFNELALVEKKHGDEVKQLNEEISNIKTEMGNISQIKIDMEGECNELRGKLTMLQFKTSDIEENLVNESEAHKRSQILLEERAKLLTEMSEQSKRVTLEPDTIQGDKQMSYSPTDGDNNNEIFVNNENQELKIKIQQLERQLRISSEKFEDVITSLKEKGSLLGNGKQDRDSGIVITQEIKSIIDSYNKEVNDGSNEPSAPPLFRGDSEDVFMTPRTSVSSDNESVDKRYKKLCYTYDLQIKELTNKLMTSEEKVIELAEELDKHLISEDEYISKYGMLVTRIEDLQSQTMDSQELLQSKADELERERKNVINLVEVTSAYIKELEGSLAESKVKIQDLQSVGEPALSDRQPPEGSATPVDQVAPTPSEIDSTVTKSRSSSMNEQDLLGIQQKLSAKILTLQSDISELKANHETEIKLLCNQDEMKGKTLHQQLSVTNMNEESEDMMNQIKTLELELEEQKENYSKDITLLQEHYQMELKAAFSGDTGGIDMLNRLQELEEELEQTRKESENKVKELNEKFEKDKEQMKDDMATVLQASLSMGSLAGNNEPINATQEDLEERVIALEEELVEMQEKYQEELEMEKDVHQKEMEDTIRDMMILRDAGNRYDDEPDQTDAGSHGSSFRSDSGNKELQKLYSVDEVDEIKTTYEKKLETHVEEHEAELAQVRDDMALIISSIKQGSSSDTIIDLQGKTKDLEQEIDDIKAGFKSERKNLQGQLKTSENKNFFAMRRNEEMGSKIYQMQIELEEVDRKHQFEIEAYQDKLASLGGGVDAEDGVNESLKLQEELKENNRELEKELEEIHHKHQDAIEATTLGLQQEKREAIEEMTDKVLKLESLIDEIKESHSQEIQKFEKVSRNEDLEAVTQDKMRIKELEVVCENLKEEYEEEIEELAKEHKKEAEKLRLFYEKEIGEIKKRSSSDLDHPSRKSSFIDHHHHRTSIDHRRASMDHGKGSIDHGKGSIDHDKASIDNGNVKQALKEQKEKFEKELEALKMEHEKEKEVMTAFQQSEIADIRTQYDEKLKMSYKEGLRRHSVSERKSDATKIRELIQEKETYATKLLELDIKYDTDTKELKERIVKLQKIISDLKGGLEIGKGIDLSKQTIESLVENENILEDESQKKLKEINEQIERYERRIEYYQEKSQRESTEESHRVSELQSEIVELHKEVNNIQESKRKEVYEKEKREKAPNIRHLPRRNTDGSLSRRHTDTDTETVNSARLRDPKKRWSDLQERTEVISRNIAELDGKRNPRLSSFTKVEQLSPRSPRRLKDEGKSGTVLARKTLWESITIDDAPVKPKISKQISSVK